MTIVFCRSKYYLRLVQNNLVIHEEWFKETHHDFFELIFQETDRFIHALSFVGKELVEYILVGCDHLRVAQQKDYLNQAVINQPHRYFLEVKDLQG